MMAETKKTTETVETVETEAKVKAPKKTTAKKSTTTKAKTTKKAAAEEAKAEETVATETVEEVKAPAKRTRKPKAVKEEKKEEPKVVKPVVTSATAKAINVKCTPRKCRLVIDLVRGKDCDEALGILFNSHHSVSTAVAKVIKSAMANATNNFGLDGEKLYVASIQASDSVKMKRYLPRARGSASGLVKRFCNIYVTVKERIKE